MQTIEETLLREKSQFIYGNDATILKRFEIEQHFIQGEHPLYMYVDISDKVIPDEYLTTGKIKSFQKSYLELILLQKILTTIKGTVETEHSLIEYFNTVYLKSSYSINSYEGILHIIKEVLKIHHYEMDTLLKKGDTYLNVNQLPFKETDPAYLIKYLSLINLSPYLIMMIRMNSSNKYLTQLLNGYIFDKNTFVTKISINNKWNNYDNLDGCRLDKEQDYEEIDLTEEVLIRQMKNV